MSKTIQKPRLKSNVLNVSRAVAILFAAAPCFAQSESTVNLSAVVITGQAASAETAPSMNSLAARSAQSVVSDQFIRNYTSPVADYTQTISMTPGVFSSSPNGVGLGDAKVTIRGLSDSNTVFSFDGIPFNDTNGVSHHS